MKTLNYKGFIGSIEKEEDNTFYGKVLDLDKDTLITYQGDCLEEMPTNKQYLFTKEWVLNFFQIMIKRTIPA